MLSAQFNLTNAKPEREAAKNNPNPMADNYCMDCKNYTEVVFDHSAGDTICLECGLVLESRSIDETSEWRNFADDTRDNDPNRVGSPVNTLLTHGGLATVISKQAGSDRNLSVTTRMLAGRGHDSDKNIVMGFKNIAGMADRLSLVATIKDRANEIYKKLDDQKCTKGRNMDALLAACIYIACRIEGKARTIKEICSVANGASKKDVGRAKTFIEKQLKVEMGDKSMDVGTIQAGDYLRRFCSNLGMSNKEIKVVQETVQRSQEFDIRRNPISVAAAIIYMILQLSDKKKTLRDISLSCTVAEGTIKNAYKDLYPHTSSIVPQWYATEVDLKKLRC